MEITTLSRMSIGRKVEDGTFPQPVRPSEGTIAWYSDELQTWMDQLPRARKTIIFGDST